MVLLTPVVQPVAVGPSGVIVEVSVPHAYRKRRLSRIIVSHTSGSLDSFDAEISTDPLVLDPLKRVAFYGNTSPSDRIDDDNVGAGFAHDLEERTNWSESPKSVYVKVTPNKGTDNAFSIGIYAESR